MYCVWKRNSKFIEDEIEMRLSAKLTETVNIL